ncbi:MAG: UvrD-helicase domain-containing protein [Clostridiales bacterium]|nr:UvrD-helicase domain-containing protein [Clostridiales bacterium]
MDYLKDLNKEQIEAVLHTEGPLLILAGAGSGKTRVLTHRIVHLVCDRGVRPYNILAFTFTNKAAREMKERIMRMVGDQAGTMWVGTFHATCARILRRDIEKIGYGREFIIYDSDDQQKIVKECLKELNLNETNFPPRMVLDRIGRAKDEIIEPSIFTKMNAGDFRMEKIALVYKLYQEKLKKNNALDFDDMILHTIKLLLDHPPVLEYYQEKFRYIHVDEYQDTNTAQFSLISLLAAKYKNLCVVGDDDQSIYGWRGANIRNILDFEKEYKGCKVIKLEQNYRSTGTILEAANNVIKNNFGRKGKKLWTKNTQGSSITVHTAVTEHAEANFVSKEIQWIMKTQGLKHGDFAILYRMNAQSRVLEDILMKDAIPYKVYGGKRFYDRKEIRDMIAYLRVIQNPADEISLKRIINVPRRGIGDATVEALVAIAAREGLALYNVIGRAMDFPELSRAAKKLLDFLSMLEGFRSIREQVRVSQLMEEVMTRSGMVAEYKADKTEEAQERLENIKEFVTVALEYDADEEKSGQVYDEVADKSSIPGMPGTSDDRKPYESNNEESEAPVYEESEVPDNEVPDNEEPEELTGLIGFLAKIALVTDIDNMGEVRNNVVMMTLHGSKGLEFPVVFMVGMEEGVFPGYRTMTNENELEEERRLCYVGITRAMERLYITNTKCRTLFASTSYNPPSRFLKEIPDELVEEGFEPGYGRSSNNNRYTGFDIKGNNIYSCNSNKTGNRGNGGIGGIGVNGVNGGEGYSETGNTTNPGSSKAVPAKSMSGYQNPDMRSIKPVKPIESVSPKARGIDDINTKSSGNNALKAGDRVVSKNFGEGAVISSEKKGDIIVLEIDFANFGKKKLVAAFANLTKIE